LYCTTNYDSIVVVFLHLALIMQQKQHLDLRHACQNQPQM
jgi:hypothetical protein